jgi:hypothetical protein
VKHQLLSSQVQITPQPHTRLHQGYKRRYGQTDRIAISAPVVLLGRARSPYGTEEASRRAGGRKTCRFARQLIEPWIVRAAEGCRPWRPCARAFDLRRHLNRGPRSFLESARRMGLVSASGREFGPNIHSWLRRHMVRLQIHEAHQPDVAMPHSNFALNDRSRVNSNPFARFVSCAISRTGFDDLFHFSATSADEHRKTMKYHEQIQVDYSGIGACFGWHAKCIS